MSPPHHTRWRSRHCVSLISQAALASPKQEIDTRVYVFVNFCISPPKNPRFHSKNTGDFRSGLLPGYSTGCVAGSGANGWLLGRVVGTFMNCGELRTV